MALLAWQPSLLSLSLSLTHAVRAAVDCEMKRRLMDTRDRKVLLAVAGQLVANSSATDGPLAGAMFWNGAHNDSSDGDG